MMEDKNLLPPIRVADFSKTPNGRTSEDGPYNGYRYRVQFVRPAFKEALENNKVAQFDFDDIVPPGSSFLDEAFAGLIKEDGYPLDTVKKHISFISKFPLYKMQIEDYYVDAETFRVANKIKTIEF